MVVFTIPDRILLHDNGKARTFHKIVQPILKIWQIQRIKPILSRNSELANKRRNAGVEKGKLLTAKIAGVRQTRIEIDLVLLSSMALAASTHPEQSTAIIVAS